MTTKKSGQTNSQGVINWTRPKLEAFKAAYNVQCKLPSDTFTFEGNEFVCAYARYLIMYLESKLSPADRTM